MPTQQQQQQHPVGVSVPALVQVAAAPKQTFYRRELPEPAIAFSSKAGRRLFAEALREGDLACYFPLAENFRPQHEPAYCGLTSLTVTLNALGVDPGRVWKGPWRWFHEEMLDCCFPLSRVRESGITFTELASLARCNGAEATLFRQNKHSLEAFRAAVQRAARLENGPFMLVSYSRKALGQTGDGHFSPVGGYHRGTDQMLIMDVATFKYPPQWLPVPLVYHAMSLVDKSSGLCRGWMSIAKSRVNKPGLYFALNNSGADWPAFFAALRGKLSELHALALTQQQQQLGAPVAGASGADLEAAIPTALRLMHAGDLLSQLRTHAERFELHEVAEGHRQQVDLLLQQLRATAAYAAVRQEVDASPHLRESLSAPDKLDILTVLLFALPPRLWAAAAGQSGTECSAHCGCFHTQQLPEPLRSEVKAVQLQIDSQSALLQPCAETDT
jgi:hypothetical protein